MRDPPEIVIRGWRSETSFRGKEAIRAAGWMLHLLLFARALRILAGIPIAGSMYLGIRWLFS